MADVVGQDDEVFGDVERLAGAEENIREQGIHERVGIATGAVEEEHGIIDVARCIAVGRAESEVMQLELGQRLASAETKVGQNSNAVYGGPGNGKRLLRGWRTRGGHGHGLAICRHTEEEHGGNWGQDSAQVHRDLLKLRV